MLGAPNSAASMTKLAPGRPPKEVLLWPWLLWILPLLPPLCLLWAAQSPPKALVLRPAGPSTGAATEMSPTKASWSLSA